jgi:Lhr-like helicase
MVIRPTCTGIPEIIGKILILSSVHIRRLYNEIFGTYPYSTITFETLEKLGLSGKYP